MNDPRNHRRQPLQTVALAGALAFTALAGCKSNGGPGQAAASTAADPADANLAQPYTGGAAGGYGEAQTNSQPKGQARVLGQSQAYSSQSSGENYDTQTPAPIIRQAPQTSEAGSAPGQYYPVPQAGGGNQASYYGDANAQGGNAAGGNYTDAEAAGEQALAETDQAPPPLPVYDQPPAPADNYIWNPGYWNYASAGYYFVPGIWCAPPFLGALWTPPYWGYYNHHYLFHRGYWGPHIGYYGGINYGFGYVGSGYYGGYWRGHDFYYNRAVTNVNLGNVHNVYQRTVVYNNQTYGPHPIDRVSYNGGPGGLRIQPRPEELAASHEAHYAPLPVQQGNRLAAAGNRSQFLATNGGRPAQAFSARPVGLADHIPASPREQAFNHGALPGAPAVNSRPDDPGRLHPAPQPAFANPRGTASTQSTQPVLNGRGEFGRPGTPTQPAPRDMRPGDMNRGGTGLQPTFNNERLGSNQPNRPAQSPASAYTRPAAPTPSPYTRPENLNRPGASAAQPAYNNGRQPEPGRFPQPAQPGPAAPRATYARPVPQPQPSSNPGSEVGHSIQSQPQTQPQQYRPNLDAGRQSQPQMQQYRPNLDAGRQPQPQMQQYRPNLDAGRQPQPQTQPQTRPNFEPGRQSQPQGQPQPQTRPNFEPGRQSQPQGQPQPQTRPNFEEQRPAPAISAPQPRPQPQVSAPRPSPPPPAAAPHAEAAHPAPAANPHPH